MHTAACGAAGVEVVANRLVIGQGSVDCRGEQKAVWWNVVVRS